MVAPSRARDCPALAGEVIHVEAICMACLKPSVVYTWFVRDERLLLCATCKLQRIAHDTREAARLIQESEDSLDRFR